MIPSNVFALVLVYLFVLPYINIGERIMNKKSQST